MSQRLQFVELASQPDANISQLCRHWGISRKTGYKWLNRYQKNGAAGLKDQSRRPKKSPGHTGATVEQAVLAVRTQYPTWGGRKIHRHLLNQGHRQPPAASTITTILQRHGQIDPAESQKRQAWQRFERAAPNELWQMDFKGHFAMTNGQRCHPLTVLDDHSRFLLCLQACQDETTLTVQTHLKVLFRTFGLPDRMLMDNGSPWGDRGAQPFTRLTVWLIRQGIAVSHSRPYHPQTQGKEERLHRTLKYDLLERTALENLQHCQVAFDQWRTTYNRVRPHEALNLDVPQSRYRVSHNSFCEQLPPIAYPEDMLVRRVDINGRISLRNRPIRIGKAFYGYPVGLSPTETDGVYNVYFCQQHIKQIRLDGLAE